MRKTPSYHTDKGLFLSPVILGRQLGHSLTFYFQLAGSLWVAGYEGERDKCVTDITSKMLGCGRWLCIFPMKSWSVRRTGWWGWHSCLSLSSACTGNLCFPTSTRACKHVSPCFHIAQTTQEKRQLFSEMKCGVTAAVFFIQYLWPFLHSCFLHPASHGRIEVPIGMVLFQRCCGTSQGGHPSWVSHSAGQIIRRGFILLFWQQGGRKQSPRMGRLALQLWQSSDGPFCRSSHPLSSCLICLCPTMTAGENGWDREGKHPNPSWHSSFRLGRTTVKEQPFCIQCHWKDGTGNRTLCCLYFFQKSLVCCATSLWVKGLWVRKHSSTRIPPWSRDERKSRPGYFSFPFSFFFLKTTEIKEATHIFTQQ